jgi:hypothetical protein
MGIGDSTGVIYGESGSIKHCYGVIFYTSDNGVIDRNNTANKTRYVIMYPSPRVYVTGSVSVTSGISMYFQAEEYRQNMVIMQFSRTADPGNITIRMTHPNTAGALDSGNSGSSVLGEAMSKNNWTQLLSYVGLYGETSVTFTAKSINQASNGTFDSVILTNPYRWSDIALYEVVLRASGSI